jgi:NADH pyrophosphatase NudC (nudix superfamily)
MSLIYCPRCAQKLTRQKLADRERLACPDPDCGWVFWDNPLPVVAGIVEHEGNVILIQNKGWPETWWGLVTGFLERNETTEEGIRREVMEDWAWKPRSNPLWGSTPSSNVTNSSSPTT